MGGGSSSAFKIYISVEYLSKAIYHTKREGKFMFEDFFRRERLHKPMMKITLVICTFLVLYIPEASRAKPSSDVRQEGDVDDGGSDNNNHDNHGHDNDGHDNHGHDNDGHDNDGHEKDGHLNDIQDNDGHNNKGHDKDGHRNSGRNDDGHDYNGHDNGRHYMDNDHEYYYSDYETNHNYNQDQVGYYPDYKFNDGHVNDNHRSDDYEHFPSQQDDHKRCGTDVQCYGQKCPGYAKKGDCQKSYLDCTEYHPDDSTSVRRYPCESPLIIYMAIL
uniref:Uncharacterized protein n=1 Tax=Romanomermis culicivorax TaxID=13658 RepID=A0A915HU71_ROMCU